MNITSPKISANYYLCNTGGLEFGMWPYLFVTREEFEKHKDFVDLALRRHADFKKRGR